MMMMMMMIYTNKDTQKYQGTYFFLLILIILPFAQSTWYGNHVFVSSFQAAYQFKLWAIVVYILYIEVMIMSFAIYH